MKQFFRFDELGTNYRREFTAGLTTFLSMAYILAVNPMILGEAGMDEGAVFTATALAAIIGTLLMGLLANYPIGLAPSLGLNSFFTYSVVVGMGIPWETALAGVLASGIIMIFITLLKIREKIINVIPKDLKYATSAGIGFFIAFIGLKNAEIIIDDPATFVALGNLTAWPTLLAIIGFIITIILLVRGFNGGIFYGMVITAIIGVIFGISDRPDQIVSAIPSLEPTFGVAFQELGNIFTLDLLVVIFTFLFVDFFDTAGTLIAIASQAGIMKGNKIPRASKALFADSTATVAGSVLGTSTTTSLIESSSGIAAGGRSGFTAVVVAGLFFVSMFFSPLLVVITSYVTAPALIIVGILMAKQLYNIEWGNLAIAIPAFVTVIMMPLTFSVATGIALGFILYPIMMFAIKRRQEIHPIMYGLSVIFIIYFAYLV
ncbi:NCS2 family permease [Desertibacillus haloalkaliphilus]|uniref:NCS2 family permease n=1 Tax=Desertibacillus haloalkaliphilus TaxID=1328930 RepID=UPI001C25A512|nr:NCS2 family permease [Desertibacillus haloalkaliphilus]MBU8905813.1 NCS2 family permease [Desertibacillus haloalkaliphilus]